MATTVHQDVDQNPVLIVGRLCESANSAPASRPKRLRRLDVLYAADCPVYFLTICTAHRARLLANVETHERFLAFCQQSPELAGVWVGRYVLMPDHIHAFVSAQSSEAVSRWVGSLKKFFAAGWRKQGRTTPFWQESFFDHLLRSNESYEEKWMYVLQNPVRAGLTKNASDWPFASEVHPVQLSEGQLRHADSQSRPTIHTGVKS
jgi:REP element-mobilizing transposase RayT